MLYGGGWDHGGGILETVEWGMRDGIQGRSWESKGWGRETLGWEKKV